MRLHQRLQILLRPPSARSDPPPSESPAASSLHLACRISTRSHRRRKVAARRHPIPELVEVVLQILLELRNRLLVHAGRSLVRLDPLDTPPRPPVWKYETALPSSIRLLPLLVDLIGSGWTMPPLRSSPITGPSSLLRAAPPLCPASVLSPSWVFHLELLPSHRGDRFPRSAQEPGPSSRRLHAGRHLGSKQVSPRAGPGSTTAPRF